MAEKSHLDPEVYTKLVLVRTPKPYTLKSTPRTPNRRSLGYLAAPRSSGIRVVADHFPKSCGPGGREVPPRPGGLHQTRPGQFRGTPKPYTLKSTPHTPNPKPERTADALS